MMYNIMYYYYILLCYLLIYNIFLYLISYFVSHQLASSLSSYRNSVDHGYYSVHTPQQQNGKNQYNAKDSTNLIQTIRHGIDC